MKRKISLLFEFYEQYAVEQYKKGFVDGRLFETTMVFEDEKQLDK